MLRSCQLITPSRIAGAERSTLSLCEHLVRSGVAVRIGCKPGSPLIDLMRSAGLDASALPIQGKLNLAAPLRIVRFAREFGASVLHTQLSTAAVHGSLAGRLMRLPVVAHVRALNTATCYRWATRCIAVSQAVRRHLVAQGMEESRIDVVYNGVDPQRYYLPCSASEARSRLGLPGGLLLCVVAHLSAKKGHACLLRACAELLDLDPQVVFLGDGPEREALARLAQELGLGERVIFAGFQPDVLPYYAAADVVVLPSLSGEGLPRALLEAGLLGRACVASDLSGVPEIVRDGETGFVVPPGDVPALRDRIRDLAGQPAERMRFGERAREWVAATFTVEGMVRGTLESYARAGVVG